MLHLRSVCLTFELWLRCELQTTAERVTCVWVRFRKTQLSRQNFWTWFFCSKKIVKLFFIAFKLRLRSVHITIDLRVSYDCVVFCNVLMRSCYDCVAFSLLSSFFSFLRVRYDWDATELRVVFRLNYDRVACELRVNSVWRMFKNSNFFQNFSDDLLRLRCVWDANQLRIGT